MSYQAPFWPRMMKRATACAYLDLSPAELEREVAAGRLPHPLMLGNGLHWSRAEIDTYLERLSGAAEAAGDWRKKVKLYQS
jgi:predicted DNA-binding transcriptional regulator AlpA